MSHSDELMLVVLGIFGVFNFRFWKWFLWNDQKDKPGITHLIRRKPKNFPKEP